MFDPNDPGAYLWPTDFAKAWVADYDREHPQPVLPDPYPLPFVLPMRFIAGIDQADLDPEFLKPVDVIWQIPEPMTITMREIDPELLEILFGGPVVPLCYRQIPAKGTE